MEKIWIDWPEDCPDCGDNTEVKTSCQIPDHAFDGDEARCLGCGNTGSVTVYDEDCAYVEWSENEEYWKKVMAE